MRCRGGVSVRYPTVRLSRVSIFFLLLLRSFLLAAEEEENGIKERERSKRVCTIHDARTRG